MYVTGVQTCAPPIFNIRFPKAVELTCVAHVLRKKNSDSIWHRGYWNKRGGREATDNNVRVTGESRWHLRAVSQKTCCHKCHFVLAVFMAVSPKSLCRCRNTTFLTRGHIQTILISGILSLCDLCYGADVFQLHPRRGVEQSESVLSNAGIYNRLLAPTGWFSNQPEIIVLVKRTILSMGHSSRPATQR